MHYLSHDREQTEPTDRQSRVSHLPPGTSKWNKIEHRLFSFISQNWRAKPLVSYRAASAPTGFRVTAVGPWPAVYLLNLIEPTLAFLQTRLTVR